MGAVTAQMVVGGERSRAVEQSIIAINSLIAVPQQADGLLRTPRTVAVAFDKLALTSKGVLQTLAVPRESGHVAGS